MSRRLKGPDRQDDTRPARSTLTLRLVLAGLAFGAAVWAFGGLLEEVLDARTLVRWDIAVNAWFGEHAAALALRVLSAVTLLGSVVAGGVVLLVAIWLWRRRRWHLLLTWLTANLLGQGVLYLIKMLVHRDRPAYSGRYLHGHSYSFPSGHTMTAVMVYALLVHVLGAMYGWRPAQRAWGYAVAALVALLVAFSRVYLGVHYPSDVAGGLLAGVAWVVATVAIVSYAGRRATDGSSS